MSTPFLSFFLCSVLVCSPGVLLAYARWSLLPLTHSHERQSLLHISPCLSLRRSLPRSRSPPPQSMPCAPLFTAALTPTGATTTPCAPAPRRTPSRTSSTRPTSLSASPDRDFTSALLTRRDSEFDFWHSEDPTHGSVNYLGKDEATEKKLAYVDNGAYRR